MIHPSLPALIEDDADAHTRRINALIRLLKLDSLDSQLSHASTSKIDDLVISAEILKLRHADDESFLSAILDLNREIKELQVEEIRLDQLKKQIDHVQGTALDMLQNANDLLHHLMSIEPSEIQLEQEWSNNASILELKHQDYVDKIEMLRDDLPDIPEIEIDLENLQKLDSEIMQLYKQLNEKERRLQSFQELPPDYALASLKIVEMRNELVIEEQNNNFTVEKKYSLPIVYDHMVFVDSIQKQMKSLEEEILDKLSTNVL